MGATIDRVHFEERQYLRSYDWEAEQSYHIEMRRRLNLALHTWGIVDGLDLQTTDPGLGLPLEFHVSRGMAIDAYGREIVVAVDYPLTDADLSRNRIQDVGTYDLAIVYKRELATPPSPGYRLCDVKDQYTRWRESFEVLITAKGSTPVLPDPPGVADPLSDDPARDSWPVILGELRTQRPNPGKLEIKDVKAVNRTYAGVRAQRVVTPASSVSSDTGEAALPVAVAADVLAKSNLFLGEDFEITNATGTPPPDPTRATPREAGVLKMTNDLFLKGELFTQVAGDWVSLTDAIAQHTPDVHVGSVTVTVDPTASPPDGNGAVTGSVVIPIDTTLKKLGSQPKNPSMSVSLSAVGAANIANLKAWAGLVEPGNNPLRAAVEFKSAVLASGQTWNFTVSWTVGPLAASGTARLPLQNITIGYVAVFLP